MEDVAGAQGAAGGVADGAVQGGAVAAAVVDAAVQDVVVVEGDVAGPEADDELARQLGGERGGVALGAGARAAVRARHQHQRLVLPQGQVVLGVEGRAGQAGGLVLGRGVGGDVVAVPAQGEVALGPDEHVEELHDEPVVAAAQQLARRRQQRVREVQVGEEVAAGQGRVHQVLHAPDAVRGRRRRVPRRELLADRPHVRPLPGPRQRLGLARRRPQRLELVAADHRPHHDEAVALQVGQEGRR
ncbi:hypothetical protein CDD83_1444 [Cordyceps sp. RAO-2017]|nr:hypothetical protein CDD83_1444 [Cordyceps sp. RAO-2017]